MDDRKEFLVEMYNQLFNDINRHILIVWQAIGVLVGSTTIFVLMSQNVLDKDVGVSLILLLCIWAILTTCDSAFWYNRNLAMISNIERQFLVSDDSKEIHYFFKKHRSHDFIDHLSIQASLIIGVALLSIIYHLKFGSFTKSLAYLPYFIFVIFIILPLYYWFISRKRKYDEFIEKSPGKDV